MLLAICFVRPHLEPLQRGYGKSFNVGWSSKLYLQASSNDGCIGEVRVAGVVHRFDLHSQVVRCSALEAATCGVLLRKPSFDRTQTKTTESNEAHLEIDLPTVGCRNEADGCFTIVDAPTPAQHHTPFQAGRLHLQQQHHKDRQQVLPPRLACVSVCRKLGELGLRQDLKAPLQVPGAILS